MHAGKPDSSVESDPGRYKISNKIPPIFGLGEASLPWPDGAGLCGCETPPTANCSLIVVRFSLSGSRQPAEEEDQFFKTVASTEKSLICSYFQPLQASVDGPSQRQPSPVIQTQSQAPRKTAVIQFPPGSAARRRPK